MLEAEPEACGSILKDWKKQKKIAQHRVINPPDPRSHGFLQFSVSNS
jgi:hypothetical protein